MPHPSGEEHVAYTAIGLPVAPPAMARTARPVVLLASKYPPYVAPVVASARPHTPLPALENESPRTPVVVPDEPVTRPTRASAVVPVTSTSAPMPAALWITSGQIGFVSPMPT